MNHIAEFQKKNGLKDDGIVGKDTIKKMRYVFDIPDDAQMAHFLANIHHETGGFKVDTEKLNYSAAGLVATWPGRYKDKRSGKPNALAVTLASRPEKIANNVYADRMGNGNEASGDGWKYRGRGSLQLTGKNNYKLFSDFMNDPEIVTNPDRVATRYFWESALFYFTRNKLWSKMKGATPADVKVIRKAVNGGYIGLKDVQEKFTYYYNIII
ncbi:glycoside hydrolase [Flavobacterium album]|uniref:Glycoside hydrolase n=1 Tax=Flavobacterium album TaxID=2175091 RepID=A0A2S1QXH9_9FLAO|nr:peptidoglycan-binding protein [Flavobacterium album]AWH84941.1 glycoside hydrolase [Flavobacterium album]